MFKFIKPTTPSQRNLIRIISKFSHKKPLLKKKLKGFKNKSGRNNQGKITNYHRGGGHKRNYRMINFSINDNLSFIVTSLEYDPNRTANIASIYDYINKTYSYIISPKYLKIGDIIKSGPNADINLGHILPLEKIPEGSVIYNLWSRKNKFADLSRSAGSFCQILEINKKNCKVKLKSGTIKEVSKKCFASIGIVSNDLQNVVSLNKAGRSRWLNKRPIVRGVAMNPVDHPHGGGEGKKSGRKYTPWGKAKAYSSMVERTAHNGFVVGSIPAKLKGYYVKKQTYFKKKKF